MEAAEAFTYPVVIKPVRSRILTESGWSHATVHYAYSREELADLYEKVGYLASHPSLVQDRIVGPGAGVFVLFDRGRLRAAFAHRRLRERPPSGGTSVLRESIALDPVLRDHAVRLLAPLGWHGVAMLEFKQDVSTGRHFLMEVNGRFWGSLQLAIDAGVDFPFLLYELARRREIPEAPGYRVGTKSRWLLGDLDHLVARLLNSDRALCLAEGAPSRLSTLVNFLKFAEPGLRYEVASTGDPGPFWHELRQYGRSLATGAGERLSRRVERARVLAARLARTTIPL
jgi:predicted ATP-grasp superfamily ATP-dependent carboligase